MVFVFLALTDDTGYNSLLSGSLSSQHSRPSMDSADEDEEEEEEEDEIENIKPSSSVKISNNKKKVSKFFFYDHFSIPLLSEKDQESAHSIY
jgi:hypothetical protein